MLKCEKQYCLGFRVGPAINPKVDWHGDDGSHAGEEPKKDQYTVTLEPKLTALNVHV